MAGKTGAGWENGAGWTQVISEDAEALLCLPGVEVKGSGPVTGTFLWGLPRSHFHKEMENNIVEDTLPGPPELPL